MPYFWVFHIIIIKTGKHFARFLNPNFFLFLGNYFILPFWVRSPAGQAPIDLHELEWTIQKSKKLIRRESSVEYLQLERKESDI